MKKLILTPLLLLVLSISFGQSKIAYVEYDKILFKMPEIETVKAKLEQTQKGYETNIEAMKKEMDEIANLIQNTPTMDETIKNGKIRRYQNLQQEIQDFAAQAQEKIQLKEEELMKPLTEKLNATIKELALAKGIDFVLSKDNAGGNILIFAKNEQDNISKLVMDKLGIVETAATTGAVKATESMMVKPTGK
jgi:outer membrane protein